MQKKWFKLFLISIFATLSVMPSVAAEELKTTNNQIASNFIQTEIKNPYDLPGSVSHLNWTRSSYDHKPYQRSLKFNVSHYLPVPLEIDSSAPSLFDPEVRLGLDPKWKEESLSCTFGIKYSFSRFELQHFAKSIMSLFGNMSKNTARKGSQRKLPVSFYLSVPEY
jgi:hypothetical protein